MAINSARIQSTLRHLAAFGALPAGGTTRLSYSSEFLQAQQYLQKEMQAAGMQTEIDAIGNLIGTFKGREPDLPAVMSGSHLDTVPQGGNYDGALGIAAALETARSWHEEGFIPRRSLQVLAAVEEEGTAFSLACFGVRTRSGEFRNLQAEMIKCPGSEKTLADFLRQADLPQDALQRAAVGFENLTAFIELHIEQGAELDEQQLQTGIVTHIVGYDRLHLTLLGEANHAGTTAMHRRKDAAAAGAEIILGVRDLARRDNSFVATVGKFEVEPDVPNIVPGKVKLCVETRSYADDILQKVRCDVWKIIEKACSANGVRWQIDGDFHVAAVPLTEQIIDVAEKAAQKLQLKYRRLPSWAGHDTQILAGAGVPTGMIFVPSVNGISHAPEEYSSAENILCGVQLLEAVLRQLTE